jgi:periplasmic mercuric ion binding protein
MFKTMRTLKIFLAAIFAVVLSATTSAQTNGQKSTNQQSTKTATFKVWGACEMCKTRIENAVITEGATTADWDLKTKMLTVTFDPKKTSVDAFSKKLASVGHDTEKYKAPDEVYAKLPGCCHYERSK